MAIDIAAAVIDIAAAVIERDIDKTEHENMIDEFIKNMGN